mgnify:FL=1
MNREFSRLPASELRIMQALWQGHPQMSRQEIQEIVNRQRRLAPTTINSLLARLENKGFVSVKKEGKNNLYTVLVEQDEYRGLESRAVLDQVFDNSLTSFVRALYRGKQIPEEKLEELEELVKSLEEQ